MLIDFYGTPTGSNRSRFAKGFGVATRTDVLGSLMAGTSAMVADSVASRDYPNIFAHHNILPDAGIYLLAIGLGLGIMHFADRRTLRGQFSEDTIKDMVIDTNPNRRKPYDPSRWQLAAEELHNTYRTRFSYILLGVGLPLALIAGGMLSVSGGYPAMVVAAGFIRIAAIFIAPIISTYVSMRRWGNVASGKWHIVDRPPPERVRAPFGVMQAIKARI